MNIAQLIEALSDPSAYPHAGESVQVQQTHISVVFLAGPFAYKIKKPVQFDFVDFSTLELRRFYCAEEVRLNRRLAGPIYHDVVPITRENSHLLVDGDGEVVEWAVQMDRLPEERTLLATVKSDQASPDQICTLAQRIAGFHSKADTGSEIAAYGRYEVVAGNARENLEQATRQIGQAIGAAVFQRLHVLTTAALAKLRPTIEKRAANGVIRETHGDLRLEHVYFFPDRPPPNDLIIIDCIEFNERFRYADPVSDVAFLVMDLLVHGRRDLAGVFAETYFQASGDEEGRSLLRYYVSYRAAVRAKVAGIKAQEPEVPQAERDEALAKARARWLLALAELEEPGRRPCLLLVGGLPGTGKSTLARALAEQANARVIRSDEVRKELAGVAEQESKPASFESGIYTAEWTERTYAECLRRADALLFEGNRVIVDATFAKEAWRNAFLDLAQRWGMPALFFVCRTEPEVVRTRLANRKKDVSDADWSVFVEAAARWELPGDRSRAALREVASANGPDSGVELALQHLRSLGLQA
jgi:aminoglycoside phosphotransferase family enzyme/predicted kinase